MRVVHLNGPFFVEVFYRAALFEMNANQILQRSGNKEVLLFQPQFLAFDVFIIWIKDL